MISVCIATFNGEKYIADQLVSILSQIGESDEVILSDDGSTDRTLAVVNEIEDKRIKIFNNTSNHGYTGNFYNALSKVSGDYIFLSDQDDVWLPDKVKVTIQYLQIYDFVVSDAKEVNKDLYVITESRFEKYKVKKGFLNNLIKGRYLGCCMAFKKCLLEKMLPPPTYENSYPHDLWIALVAEKYFKTSLINQPLILYRRHDSNASNGGEEDEKTRRTLAKKIASRFNYISEIIKINHR